MQYKLLQCRTAEQGLNTTDLSIAETTAVVTGGLGVIGQAIGAALAAAGATVFAFDRRQPRGRESAQYSGVVSVDVSEENDVKRAFDWISREAPSPLGILVNCAGTAEHIPLVDMTVQIWHDGLRAHLDGMFLCTREAVRLMRPASAGRIINISSQLAYLGSPGFAHYCAAKAGMLGFTRAAARELAPLGIIVNAIAPGPVDSDVLRSSEPTWLREKLRTIPAGRFGEPHEIAQTALLLAGPGAGYYVGQTLSPCGGDVML
jgi:3-oxoacyl-[acyl-carrier protein] reductase